MNETIIAEAVLKRPYIGYYVDPDKQGRIVATVKLDAIGGQKPRFSVTGEVYEGHRSEPFLPDPEIDGTDSGACEFEFTVAYYVEALDGDPASGIEPTQWGVFEAWHVEKRDASLETVDDDYEYPRDGGDIRIFTSFEDAKAR